LGIASGHHALKKYLFKCKECGQEFRLQAWRAVCPNCEKSYTLVRVVETPRVPKIRPRIFVTLLLVVYAGYLVVNLSSAPDLPLLYYYPLIIITIGAAIFALSGSFPSNMLSIVLGAWIAYSHLSYLSSNMYYIFLIMLGIGIAVLGAMDELIIRRYRSRLEQ
jgi:DNA-directed RNA polymerase subunit RPC12/RpoP